MYQPEQKENMIRLSDWVSFLLNHSIPARRLTLGVICENSARGDCKSNRHPGT